MLFSFINKTVDTVVRTPGRKVSARVKWKCKKEIFVAIVNKIEYPIYNSNVLDKDYIFALPSNTFVPAWTKRSYSIVNPDAEVLAMTLRFWGKYFDNMIIYGTVANNIFYETRYIKEIKHEPDISEIVTE
jgi:hypothetical protein